jgi:hypothetical protein
MIKPFQSHNIFDEIYKRVSTWSIEKDYLAELEILHLLTRKNIYFQSLYLIHTLLVVDHGNLVVGLIKSDELFIFCMVP